MVSVTKPKKPQCYFVLVLLDQEDGDDITLH